MGHREEVDAIIMVAPADNAPEAEIDAWVASMVAVFEDIFGEVAGAAEPEVVPE